MTFSPLAWLKLLTFLHGGDTEVGGFAISSKDNPLYLDDFVTVTQSVTATSVAFDDTAVADYFDDCIDRGLFPGCFARIWVHTHPGSSPEPSSVDEATFARVFGTCDWSLMLIVSRTQAAYARLSFSAGPTGSVLLGVQVDWAAWPELLLQQGMQLSALFETWMDEYGKNIHPVSLTCGAGTSPSGPWQSIPSFDSRRAWTIGPDGPFREEEIYSVYEQSGFDEQVTGLFEAGEMEEL